MLFTVADCLKLPSLRDCTVAAGKKGLNHIVNGATVLENYDSSLRDLEQPVNNSELVLTSFSTIKDDIGQQCDYIRHMYYTGDAGLIIYYVGVYLPDIHPRLIEVADELGFPLIVMPKNDMTRFYNEVLREIYETLFLNQNQKNHLADNIASLVSRLPENRKNINTLLRLISNNLKCTVLLTNALMECISISKWPIANNITADHICSLYQKEDGEERYLVEAEFSNRSLRIFRMPLTAIEYRDFTLYAADEFDALTLNDMYNIVEVLQLFFKLWDVRPGAIRENALIPAIIEGDSCKMRQIAVKLKIDTSAINDAVFLYPSFNNMEAEKYLEILHAMVKEIKQRTESAHKRVLLNIYDTYIVCFFMETQLPGSKKGFFEELFESVDQIYANYVYSIFPLNGNMNDLPLLYQIHDEYLHHATALFPDKRELLYGDLLFARQCYDTIRHKENSYMIQQHIIEQIIAASGNDELLKTLEVYYLDAECEIKKTSQLLYVHRNTIQYRLNKIRSITGIHPGNLTSSWLLYGTVACYRLSRTLAEG